MLHSLKREKREGKKEKQVLCVAGGCHRVPQRYVRGRKEKSDAYLQVAIDTRNPGG